MIENYVKEFVAITEFLVSLGQYKKNSKYICIPKNQIESMLDKNLYETSQNKLKIWKLLNWIDADDDHVTKKVYEKGKSGEKGRYIRCVKINLKVYETLKALSQK